MYVFIAALYALVFIVIGSYMVMRGRRRKELEETQRANAKDEAIRWVKKPTTVSLITCLKLTKMRIMCFQSHEEEKGGGRRGRGEERRGRVSCQSAETKIGLTTLVVMVSLFSSGVRRRGKKKCDDGKDDDEKSDEEEKTDDAEKAPPAGEKSKKAAVKATGSKQD